MKTHFKAIQRSISTAPLTGSDATSPAMQRMERCQMLNVPSDKKWDNPKKWDILKNNPETLYHGAYNI